MEAGDIPWSICWWPRKAGHVIQLEFQGLRTRQVDDVDFSPGLKAIGPGAPGAGEDQCPSSNNQAGRAKFFLLHFVLFIS